MILWGFDLQSWGLALGVGLHTDGYQAQAFLSNRGAAEQNQQFGQIEKTKTNEYVQSFFHKFILSLKVYLTDSLIHPVFCTPKPAMDLEALLNRPRKRPAAASSLHRPAAAKLPAKKRPAQVIDLDPPDDDLEFLLDKEIGAESLPLAFKPVLFENTS